MTDRKAATVEVTIADVEPIRTLINGVADAAAMFASLSDEQLRNLPDAALSGVLRFQEAAAVFAGGRAASKPVDLDPREPIVIEWEPPLNGVIRGSMTRITDARTGSPIVTAERMTIHADAKGIVTADLFMLADEDGRPVPHGKPVLQGEQILTGTFRYLVAAMKEQPPRRRADAGHEAEQ